MQIVNTLRWPVIAIVITGMLHLGAEAVIPDLKGAFTPTTIGPILLLYGLWVGAASVGRGASFVESAVSGALLGLLPLALDVVGFGILLGRGLEAGLVAGAFGFLMVVFGSILGAGYREFGRDSATASRQ